MSRNSKLTAIVVVLIAATAGGFLAGRGLRSPADAAAQTAAPPPSLITVPVEQQTLASDVIVRGTVRFGDPRQVRLAPSEYSTDSGILTEVAAPDAVIELGSVPAIVSGRPVFALSGERPVYRDLGPGVIGDDVTQLEAALTELGFDPGPADGRYDQRTATAVSAMYAAAGFAPATDGTSTVVPADEIVFFATLPIRVDEAALAPGDPVEGPLFAVTDATIGVDVALSVADAQLLSDGLAAVVEETDLGIRLDATVTAIAATPGTNGVEPNQVHMLVTPIDAPPGLVGASVKVTIAVESTNGAVLAVPAAALSTSADGAVNVQIQQPDGTVTIVAVETGLAAGGFVEITSGEIAVGDLVVIGVDAPAATP